MKVGTKTLAVAALAFGSCGLLASESQARTGEMASWYGPGFHGRRTASGETFNAGALTAAHRTLPFGTRVKVTNATNGRSVVVRINDRGPYVRGRVIDLSRAAARAIGMSGTARITLARAG
jgi:rare lipoprotein A